MVQQVGQENIEQVDQKTVEQEVESLVATEMLIRKEKLEPAEKKKLAKLEDIELKERKKFEKSIIPIFENLGAHPHPYLKPNGYFSFFAFRFKISYLEIFFYYICKSI